MSKNERDSFHDDDDDPLDENNTLLVSDDSDDSFDEDSLKPDDIIYPGLVLGLEKNQDYYVLLKKIGSGNNAFVWLAYHINSSLYRAMKIQDYQCYNDGCREVAIIKTINKYCREKNKNIYCINMLDYFVYEENKNTKFVCSVYELYAGSIQMVLNRGKHKYGLPIPVVKQITRQLLIALAALHDELKIIHTDVKPENILFKGTTNDHAKIIELFESSGFKRKYLQIVKKHGSNYKKFMDELDALARESVKEICKFKLELIDDEELEPDGISDEDSFIEGEEDGYSDYDSEGESEYDDRHGAFNERQQSVDDVIENLDYSEIHNLDEEYDFDVVLNNRPNTTDPNEIVDDKYIIDCQIALTDFGNSYFFDKRTKNEIQDRRYRAPEVVLDFNYKYACDIWSVSCVVFELLTGFTLFEPEMEPLNKDLHHLYLMEKMLGPIPLKMKRASKRSKFLFDAKRNYHIKNVAPFKQVTLKERLVKQFLFNEKDAEEICEFLMCGLKYEPNERLSAKDMLNHPWLKINY